jgi:hypothetical protein
MNDFNLEKWEKNVDKVFYLQILLDKLKKNRKLNSIQYKNISKKIKKIRYRTFLNSPHFEGKEELRVEALKLCIRTNFPSHSLAI